MYNVVACLASWMQFVQKVSPVQSTDHKLPHNPTCICWMASWYMYLSHHLNTEDTTFVSKPSPLSCVVSWAKVNLHMCRLDLICILCTYCVHRVCAIEMVTHHVVNITYMVGNSACRNVQMLVTMTLVHWTYAYVQWVWCFMVCKQVIKSMVFVLCFVVCLCVCMCVCVLTPYGN